MANPKISFRIETYHLARGLKILRTLEPNHVPVSPSQLVKTLFLDYLAKTSLQNAPEVTAADIAEIESIIACHTKAKPMSFSEFQQSIKKPSKLSNINTVNSSEVTSSIKEMLFDTSETTSSDTTLTEDKQTDSKITSVTNFAPPEDWK